jgi:hypothetical protein
MSDIRKRTGAKGVTYQVRYPTPSTKSGYAYKTFATRKEARAFLENLGSLPAHPSAGPITVCEAVRKWLDICEKTGRDGREKVEPETLKEYLRRGNVIEEYAWTKPLHELEPADVVHFRHWLLENKCWATRNTAPLTTAKLHPLTEGRC